MDLHIWLAKKRMTKTAFAKMAGVTRTHIGRACNIAKGSTNPLVSKELALKIEEMTERGVKCYDVKPELRRVKKKLEKTKIKQLDAFD
jgi:hypothetical protein